MYYRIHTLRLSAPLRLQLQLGPLHRMDAIPAARLHHSVPFLRVPTRLPPPNLPPHPRPSTAGSVFSCSVSLRRLLATSPSSPTLRFSSRPASIVHLSFPLHPAVSSQSPAREAIRARCDSPGTGRGRARMVAPMWCDEQDADLGCVHCRCRDAQAMAMARCRMMPFPSLACGSCIRGCTRFSSVGGRCARESTCRR
jgi:hypothetical protein